MTTRRMGLVFAALAVLALSLVVRAQLMPQGAQAQAAQIAQHCGADAVKVARDRDAHLAQTYHGGPVAQTDALVVGCFGGFAKTTRVVFDAEWPKTTDAAVAYETACAGPATPVLTETRQRDAQWLVVIILDCERQGSA